MTHTSTRYAHEGTHPRVVLLIDVPNTYRVNGAV